MGPEDVRDLEGRTPHGDNLCGVQILQRADHFAQDVGGNLGVQRGGVQPMSRST